jgi:hypothetical protein
MDEFDPRREADRLLRPARSQPAAKPIARLCPSVGQASAQRTEVACVRR